MLLPACLPLPPKSKHGEAVLVWTWSCQSRESWAGFFHLPFPQISAPSHKKQRQQMTQWKKLFPRAGRHQNILLARCTLPLPQLLHSACHAPWGAHGWNGHGEEERRPTPAGAT